MMLVKISEIYYPKYIGLILYKTPNGIIETEKISIALMEMEIPSPCEAKERGL
jgi:hypothetical protein